MSQEDITIHHKTPSTEFILVLHRNFFVHVLCQSLQGYTSVFCKFHQTSTIKSSTNQPKSSKNQPKTHQKSTKNQQKNHPNHPILSCPDFFCSSPTTSCWTSTWPHWVYVCAPPNRNNVQLCQETCPTVSWAAPQAQFGLEKKRVQWGVMNDAWSKLMVPRIVHWYSEIHITIRFLKNETFSRLLPK